jgi:hypothetical protein
MGIASNMEQVWQRCDHEMTGAHGSGDVQALAKGKDLPLDEGPLFSKILKIHAP